MLPDKILANDLIVVSNTYENQVMNSGEEYQGTFHFSLLKNLRMLKNTAQTLSETLKSVPSYEPPTEEAGSTTEETTGSTTDVASGVSSGSVNALVGGSGVSRGSTSGGSGAGSSGIRVSGSGGIGGNFGIRNAIRRGSINSRIAGPIDTKLKGTVPGDILDTVEKIGNISLGNLADVVDNLTGNTDAVKAAGCAATALSVLGMFDRNIMVQINKAFSYAGAVSNMISAFTATPMSFFSSFFAGGGLSACIDIPVLSNIIGPITVGLSGVGVMGPHGSLVSAAASASMYGNMPLLRQLKRVSALASGVANACTGSPDNPISQLLEKSTTEMDRLSQLFKDEVAKFSDVLNKGMKTINDQISDIGTNYLFNKMSDSATNDFNSSANIQAPAGGNINISAGSLLQTFGIFPPTSSSTNRKLDYFSTKPKTGKAAGRIKSTLQLSGTTTKLSLR